MMPYLPPDWEASMGRGRSWANKVAALTWIRCPSGVYWEQMDIKRSTHTPASRNWPWDQREKGLCHSFFRSCHHPAFPSSLCWMEEQGHKDVAQSLCPGAGDPQTAGLGRSVKTSQDFHDFPKFSNEISFFSFLLTLQVKLSGWFWKGIKSLSLLLGWSQNLFWFT